MVDRVFSKKKIDIDLRFGLIPKKSVVIDPTCPYTLASVHCDLLEALFTK